MNFVYPVQFIIFFIFRSIFNGNKEQKRKTKKGIKRKIIKYVMFPNIRE